MVEFISIIVEYVKEGLLEFREENPVYHAIYLIAAGVFLHMLYLKVQERYNKKKDTSHDE